MFLKAYGGQVLKTSIYANTLKTMHLVSSNDIVTSMLNKNLLLGLLLNGTQSWT
jgi:hypothetical protein